MDKRDDSQVTVERRRISRLPVQVNFTYMMLSPSEELNVKYRCATKNISAAGLLFESEKQIPIDSQMAVVLSIPGMPSKSFEVTAQVARVEKLFPSHRFDIGINFTKISEEQREEIKKRIERMNIISLLSRINKKDISDLHLTVNSPPMVRCYGKITPLDDQPLSAEEIKQMLYTILTEEQRRHFEDERDLDFAFSLPPSGRYRVSIYQQRGTVEAVFRNIMPIKIDELGLPEIIEELCYAKDGIIIIGGTTGSGKTTTITTMIDVINRKRGGVILSLEQPVEYIHKNMKGIVKQREVRVDVPSFAIGLKAALRQDPDVIVIGETLDSETIEAALQAAETGHLVITSLHATDTQQVFDRIISFFPAEQRSFVYARLSHSLRAIIIQSLLPHKSGVSRVLATEVCVANTAVKRIIGSGNFTELPSVIQTGAQYKMHLMQDSVEKLFGNSLISAETYELYAKKTGGKDKQII